MIGCLCLQYLKSILTHDIEIDHCTPQKEWHMHSTDIHQIKAAIADQAFIGSPFVCCPMGRVVAIRKRKGQLLVMIRGWGVRWYPIECATIETRRSRWRTSYRISDSSKRGGH